MIKTYRFTTTDCEEYENMLGDYEKMMIVENNGWICSDLMTECKSWKTAVNRFFRALEKDFPYIVEDWREGIIEMGENGCFKCSDRIASDGKYNEFHSFSYEIEEICDGLFYMFLNVSVKRYEDSTAALYNDLNNGVYFGQTFDNVKYPTVYSVLRVTPDKEYIGVCHSGSFYVKNTLECLQWLLDEIFEMNATQFREKYRACTIS